MNISTTSDCSSGCKSGWTAYFEEFANSTDQHNSWKNYCQEKRGNQEDGDSMISDASSAPPNWHQHYGVEPHSFGSSTATLQSDKKKSKQKSKTKETRMMKKRNYSLCLDDTASSPVLPFSQDNAVSHENHDSTSDSNFEEEHMRQKSLAFFKSSKKGKSGNFQGKKRQ